MIDQAERTNNTECFHCGAKFLKPVDVEEHDGNGMCNRCVRDYECDGNYDFIKEDIDPETRWQNHWDGVDLNSVTMVPESDPGGWGEPIDAAHVEQTW